MNVLVTGGAGYIGSVTVEALIARGHTVTVLDNLSTGHQGAVHADAAFVRADLRDAGVVGEALEVGGIEAVIHFASYSLVGESMREPIRYFGNNVVGTLTLLEAMIERGVKRLVLSSTAALFGTAGCIPIPEDAPVRPASVYGETKYLIERVLHRLCETAGLGFVTLRYFNAAGASATYGEDHRPETHLIPVALQVALGLREGISIYGEDYDTSDGTCVRDYVHVLDLAEAHLLAVEGLRPGEARAYNLGNGTGFSVREVVEVCRRITGHPIPERVVAGRPGDPPVLVADPSRIQRELGWTRRRAELEAIVRSAWDWHRAHPDGYGH
ncbi:MAG: UDP-glucose 4-epimerase GalE [Truepera sp.]|nr:UDP-glucose 4-epimerase GalE [Truepera sp.]